MKKIYKKQLFSKRYPLEQNLTLFHVMAFGFVENKWKS